MFFKLYKCDFPMILEKIEKDSSKLNKNVSKSYEGLFKIF